MILADIMDLSIWLYLAYDVIDSRDILWYYGTIAKYSYPYSQSMVSSEEIYSQISPNHVWDMTWHDFFELHRTFFFSTTGMWHSDTLWQVSKVKTCSARALWMLRRLGPFCISWIEIEMNSQQDTKEGADLDDSKQSTLRTWDPLCCGGWKRKPTSRWAATVMSF